MSGGPFDLGSGRNGQRPHLLGGAQHVQSAAPYRPDLSDVDYVAMGDLVVCVLAPSREEIDRGDGVRLSVPEVAREAHHHLVVSVGPLVAAKTGHDLDAGDVVVIEGGRKVSTLAGDVWFVRGEHVLSVVLRKSSVADTLPPSAIPTPPPEAA
jgi:hypothetical protein